ncbi:MAG: TolC family protein [Steroidobacteraceae bacterium]|jgi:cobalt-zinc-cadmium efflux system outer membrane protein
MTATSGRALLGAVLAPALLAACAAQQYKPAPLSPGDSASALESRALDDPGLRSFEAAYLGHAVPEWPPSSWDFQSLSLAALYFNPQLDAARARAAESSAALTTAGARPNPILGITPGIPSPYLLTLDLSFPIETAGKRRYRIESAQSSALASRLDLAQSAWEVRAAVRAAMLDDLMAVRTVESLRSEAKIREEQVDLLDRMTAVGEITRLQADAARIDLSKAHAALGEAEEHAAEARAAIAAAIGVPAAAFQNVHLSWPDLDSPPAAASLPVAEVRREAVINRLDVRSALAQYAAAEADLRLQIAKQYPDLDIGPGYTYEEKQSYFTLGFSAAIPMFDRNRGPIAEAEARRLKAAAAFQATQAEVLSKSERSLVVYRIALEELEEAVRLGDLTASRQRAVRDSVRAGEEGRLELDDADIEQLIASRTELESVARAQRALGDLEDAVQRPLTPGDQLPAGASMETLGSRPEAR